MRKYPHGDGGKKAGHRGERAISRKPLRREGRMLSAEPVCSCAHLFVHFAHETAGAARTRLSLRPLYFGGQRSCKPSGVSRREIMEPCLQAKRSPPSPVPVIPVRVAV